MFFVLLSMQDYKQEYFKTSIQFRTWLKENHSNSNGIWMLYYKKHTKKPNITYQEALDEALCFGWIDSTIKRIDDEVYVRKFTPRTNTKNWSEVNQTKVLKLIKAQKMTQVGLKKIDVYNRTGEVKWPEIEKGFDYRIVDNIPANLKTAFKNAEPAWTNFKNLSPGYRKDFINWIVQAKREETKERRMQKVIRMLQLNEKPAMI